LFFFGGERRRERENGKKKKKKKTSDVFFTRVPVWGRTSEVWRRIALLRGEL